MRLVVDSWDHYINPFSLVCPARMAGKSSYLAPTARTMEFVSPV
jgi:hypothetical protein